MRRLLIGGLCAGILMMAGTGTASAHGSLDTASPGPGERPQAGVERLEMRFRAEVSTTVPQRVEVTDAQQRPRISGEPEFAGSTLTLPLEPLEPGLHKVNYTVIATDGHTMQGGYYFKVLPGPPPETGIGVGWLVAGGAAVILVVTAIVLVVLRRRAA